MSWANVRQLLGNTECGLALTQGQYSAAIVQALKLDPTDVESKYAAALLLLWGNATQPAWKLMSEVLRFNTEMSISQRRGIFSQVQSVQSLRAIVPARFPQIVSISEYLEANPISFGGDEGALTEFNVALAGLQRESIESSVEEYSRDLVPYSIQTDRLIRLSDLAVDDAVRQRLDRELSVLVRRRSLYALADYLAERSTLKELSVVFSSTGGDTRPAKSALVRWGSQDSFYLDEFYRTVGFYLSKGQAARGVEFSVSTLPTSALAPALKVFISDDNQNWSEITSQSSVRSFELGRQVLVTVRFPQREARYWKVHFSSANRERLVLGRLSGGGVKVFGTINGGAGKGDATAAAGSGEEVVSWRGL